VHTLTFVLAGYETPRLSHADGGVMPNACMNYPAASGRGIKKRKSEKPSPQSGGVLDPLGNKKQSAPAIAIRQPPHHSMYAIDQAGYFLLEV
jgi:hypothetical protein